MTVGKKMALLFSLLIIFAQCGQDKNNPVASDGKDSLPWLHTSNNLIVDETGKTMVLRGINRSGLEYDKSGAGVSEAEIAYICQQWKAQIIRLPFNQDWMMRDANYSSFYNQVVSWVVANGAYALICFHWTNTTIKIPSIPDEEAVTMWRNLAVRYKDNPAVLYDIHNEAHDTSWELWRARASQIIEAVQAVHPKALLFVSGLDWAYDLRGWGANPLPYSNIVYSTHPYPFKGEPYAWDKYFGNFVNKIPVFVGEFGGGDQDLLWGRQLLDYLTAKNLGWTSWSWSNEPYLTKDDRRTATPFGELVKASLLRHSSGGSSGSLTISAVQALFIDKDRATIQWQTNNEADSRVRYGLTAAYSDSVFSQVTLKAHSMKLSNLKAGTAFHFSVSSRDLVGNVATGKDSTFTTLP